MPPQKRFSELTPREHEVLDLVRHGLTNEEIAARLGISLDGAKYHVSQILSKLGVSSREEAAALAAPRGRGWLRKLVPFGLFGKLAGATVVAAALAGLGVLAWGVLRSDGDEAVVVDVSGLVAADVYGLLEEAVSREGSILYSEIDFLTVDESGKEEPFYAFSVWSDLPSDVARQEFQLAPTRDSYDLAEEGLSIVAGDYVYVPDDPGEALRHEYQGFCPGIENSIASVLLVCNWWQPFNIESEAMPVVGLGLFEGTSAITLMFRESDTVQATEDDRPSLPGGTPDPDVRDIDIVTETILYLDSSSYLPLAWVTMIVGDGDEAGAFVARYTHEFVDPDSVAPDFFDPRSIGFGAENAEQLLGQIEEEAPVYWLGDELFPGNGLRDIVLTRVVSGGGLGESGRLEYETPSGVPALTIHLWRPDRWEEFRGTDLGRLLYDAACLEREEYELESGGQAFVFRANRPLFMGGFPGPIAGPLPYNLSEPPAPASPPPGVPGATIISPDVPFAPTPFPTTPDGCPAIEPDHFPAHVVFDDAVVGINIPTSRDHPIFFPKYDTLNGVQMVLSNLRRH